MSYGLSKSRIKSLREENGLSLEELSNITGIKVKVIKSYEEGEINPRLKTVSHIVESVTKYVLENGSSYKDSNRPSNKDNVNYNDNCFDSSNYEVCCNKLYHECGVLIRSLSDTKTFKDDFLATLQSINSLTSSLQFIFHKSSMRPGAFDQTLIAFTVKHALDKLINSFNALKYVNDALNRHQEENLLIFNLRLNVRESVHNLRYLFNYVNDYFKMESDTVFIIEKSDGTLYSLNQFHERRMEEAL